MEDMHRSLLSDGYCVSSKRDKNYNCVTYAVDGDIARWWEPSDEPGFYWPLPITGDYDTDYAFEQYVKAFEHEGFSECPDGALEPGFQKIALFQHEDEKFGHVTRQQRNGKWECKMGPFEDLKHRSIDKNKPCSYGTLKMFMNRRIKDEAQNQN
jgi:hypothetical protein